MVSGPTRRARFRRTLGARAPVRRGRGALAARAAGWRARGRVCSVAVARFCGADADAVGACAGSCRLPPFGVSGRGGRWPGPSAPAPAEPTARLGQRRLQQPARSWLHCPRPAASLRARDAGRTPVVPRHGIGGTRLQSELHVCEGKQKKGTWPSLSLCAFFLGNPCHPVMSPPLPLPPRSSLGSRIASACDFRRGAALISCISAVSSAGPHLRERVRACCDRHEIAPRAHPEE